MRGWASALFGAVLSAAPAAPEAAVRGVLLDWDPGPAGDLCVRVQDSHVYCYRFDAATAVQRGGLAAGLMDLRRGDTLEILPGPGPNPSLQRASLIRVLSERPKLPPRRAFQQSDYGLFDELFPRGNLTFAGVVTRVSPERLVLGTRTQGQTEVLLRQDTRFVHDGRPVAVSNLTIHARVFVRGARNLDGAIEAYQVMWGDILRPRPR